MPGEVKRIIDRIIEQRARGNDLLVHTTMAKLLFKGIDPSRYTNDTPDDPQILEQVKQIARDLGVKF
jgi:hypothetical protein